jgi:hypothetical protein
MVTLFVGVLFTAIGLFAHVVQHLREVEAAARRDAFLNKLTPYERAMYVLQERQTQASERVARRYQDW